MRCEAEVYARLQADEAELSTLNQEIAHLTVQVKLGDQHWRADLERLAACMQRKRMLQAQLASLRWVLAAETERRAG
jgi:hypothetical protein